MSGWKSVHVSQFVADGVEVGFGLPRSMFVAALQMIGKKKQ